VVFRSAFRGSKSIAERVLSSTPPRWLGNVSYSYYLVHGLALNAIVLCLRYVGLEPGPRTGLILAMAAPAFAMTLAVSMVLFLFVERPYSLEPAAERAPGRPLRLDRRTWGHDGL
jgi:exopolysaccharide production protein ExoZ